MQEICRKGDGNVWAVAEKKTKKLKKETRIAQANAP